MTRSSIWAGRTSLPGGDGMGFKARYSAFPYLSQMGKQRPIVTRWTIQDNVRSGRGTHLDSAGHPREAAARERGACLGDWEDNQDL